MQWCRNLWRQSGDGLSCPAMSRSEPALGNLNVERFAKVCKATRAGKCVNYERWVQY
jgi:hypothetical protein